MVTFMARLGVDVVGLVAISAWLCFGQKMVRAVNKAATAHLRIRV
jgi:hypothetical protein